MQHDTNSQSLTATRTLAKEQLSNLEEYLLSETKASARLLNARLLRTPECLTPNHAQALFEAKTSASALTTGDATLVSEHAYLSSEPVSLATGDITLASENVSLAFGDTTLASGSGDATCTTAAQHSAYDTGCAEGSNAKDSEAEGCSTPGCEAEVPPPQAVTRKAHLLKKTYNQASLAQRFALLHVGNPQLADVTLMPKETVKPPVTISPFYIARYGAVAKSYISAPDSE